MLMTIDVVKIADPTTKGKDQKYQYHGTFSRPYFTHGPDDAITEEVSKVATKDGEVEYTITSPKDSTTKVPAADLMEAALIYYTETQEAEVKDVSKRIEPMILLLSDAEAGRVAVLRMKKRNELLPQEINEDKTRQNAATLLVRAGSFPTMEAALEALKKMGM